MTARRFAAILSVAAALLAPGLSGAAGAADPFQDAVQQYQLGRHAEAFGRFAALANAGDVDAARTSLFMLQYGPMLFGSHWDAMPHEVRRWQTLAATGQGRKAPQWQPVALDTTGR